MAISPTYSFTIQHPRLMDNAVVSPSSSSIVKANASDDTFTVLYFTGVDAINDGFVIDLHIQVTVDLINRLFNAQVDNFLRFIVQEQPSLLFHIAAPNADRNVMFNSFYEGVALEAVAERYIPAVGSNRAHYEVKVLLVSRLQTIDKGPRSYIYEDDTKSVVVNNAQDNTNTTIEFKDSPLGSRGIALQDVLQRVFTANDLQDDLDYLFDCTAYITVDGTVQPNATFVNSSDGIGLAANYLVHSKEPDKTTGLFRYTSRAKLRFQYRENDFQFVNRLCQSEGVAILYEVASFTVRSETIANHPSDNAKSIITSEYVITFSDSSTKTVTKNRTVTRATATKPQFLYPANTILFRAIAIITDYDNRIISQLSPINVASDGSVNVQYPLTRDTAPIDLNTLGVRNIFNLQTRNDVTPEAVVVANYSEQTDAIGSTIEHSPINSVVWNIRTSATDSGTRLSMTEPLQSVTAGYGVRYYYGETLQSEADANRMAVRRMQMLKVEANYSSASSLAVDVRAGASFQLFDKYYDASNPVTNSGYAFSVSMEGYNSSVYSSSGGSVSPVENEYLNSFDFIFTDDIHRLVFRPFLKIPRPTISNGLQALVTSSQDVGGANYPDVDAYGRYLIQFLFDRAGRDSRSYKAGASRIRKAAFFADGLDRAGFHFPLHQNTRVLIAFHGQNPDMPIIVGALGDEYSESRLRSMTLSEQMSYLRTQSGSGIYFLDKTEHERVVVETDPDNDLGSTQNLEDIDFKGENYIELGLQRSSDTNQSKLNFGIRMGTSGFNQMVVAGGMHSTMMTASKYRSILSRRDEEQATDLAKKIKNDTTVYVDLNLEDLSDKAFSEELFAFRRYEVDVGDITDNLLPHAFLYRNERHVTVEPSDTTNRDNSSDAGARNADSVGTNSQQTKDPKLQNEDAGETIVAAKIPERDAPGSFYRILGDEYVYRQGHDFVYSYTGTESTIEGVVNYHFGNNMVDYYPSSASEWIAESDLRLADQRSIDVLQDSFPGPNTSDMSVQHPFSYSRYATAEDNTKPAVTVRRYLGNHAKAVEGSYAVQFMKDKYLRAAGYNGICGGQFSAQLNGSIVIESNTINLRTTPTSSIATTAIFPYQRVTKSNTLANSYEVQAGVFTRVGLGFDVKFCWSFTQFSAVHSELNAMGDYRVWSAGTRTEVRIIEKRVHPLGEDEILVAQFTNFAMEMCAGLVLTFSSLAMNVRDTFRNCTSALSYQESCNEMKGGMQIEN